MRFFPPAAPPGDNIKTLADYAHRRFVELALLLNNNVTPDDQFNATEVELEFTGDPIEVEHGLDRVPLRVEVVRADQAGQVYVSTIDDEEAVLQATANGTYRVRVS
jgi:hypothetical protein